MAACVNISKQPRGRRWTLQDQRLLELEEECEYLSKSNDVLNAQVEQLEQNLRVVAQRDADRIHELQQELECSQEWGKTVESEYAILEIAFLKLQDLVRERFGRDADAILPRDFVPTEKLSRTSSRYDVDEYLDRSTACVSEVDAGVSQPETCASLAEQLPRTAAPAGTPEISTSIANPVFGSEATSDPSSPGAEPGVGNYSNEVFTVDEGLCNPDACVPAGAPEGAGQGPGAAKASEHPPFVNRHSADMNGAHQQPSLMPIGSDNKVQAEAVCSPKPLFLDADGTAADISDIVAEDGDSNAMDTKWEHPGENSLYVAARLARPVCVKIGSLSSQAGQHSEDSAMQLAGGADRRPTREAVARSIGSALDTANSSHDNSAWSLPPGHDALEHTELVNLPVDSSMVSCRVSRMQLLSDSRDFAIAPFPQSFALDDPEEFDSDVDSI